MVDLAHPLGSTHEAGRSALLEERKEIPMDRALVLFELADTDGNGFLDLAELQEVVRKLCLQLGHKWMSPATVSTQRLQC